MAVCFAILFMFLMSHSSQVVPLSTTSSISTLSDSTTSSVSTPTSPLPSSSISISSVASTAATTTEMKTPSKSVTVSSENTTIASDSRTVYSNTTDSEDNETCNQQKPTSPKTRSSSRVPSGGLVSKEAYERFEKVAQYLDFVFLTSGLVLNILNIMVFRSREMKSPSSVILLAISSCELVVVLLQATVKITGLSYGERMRYSRSFLVVEQYLSMYGSSVFGRAVYCFTFFVAFQRLIAVAFPLKSKRISLMQKPGVVCITTFAVSVVYHIYLPFSYIVKSYRIGNDVRYRYGYSDYYTNNIAVFKGISLAGRIIFIYIPLLGCLVANLILVFVLKYHSWKRKSLQTTHDLKQTRKSERQTTMTIMASTVVFALLIMPYQTNSLAVQFSNSYGMYRSEHWLYMTIHQVGAICILLSSSTNFLFYFILGGIFRKTLLTKFRSCRTGSCQRKRKPVSETFPSAIGSSSTVNTNVDS